jgi:hypothetical protein
MKLKNMLLLSGAALLAWKLMKKKSQKKDEPGTVNKFVNRVSDAIHEPVDHIPADIARPAWRD